MDIESVSIAFCLAKPQPREVEDSASATEQMDRASYALLAAHNMLPRHGLSDKQQRKVRAASARPLRSTKTAFQQGTHKRIAAETKVAATLISGAHRADLSMDIPVKRNERHVILLQTHVRAWIRRKNKNAHPISDRSIFSTLMSPASIVDSWEELC